jgi:alkylation response protein AidB-like acyl-CoA dehydrogenase
LTDFNSILKTCDDLAEQFAKTADQHDRAGSFAYDNAEAMRTAGLSKICVPAEFGGDGLNVLQMAQVLIAIAHGDASTALGLAMHLHVIGQVAEQHLFPPDVTARLWQECVERGIFVNNVASEPEMGSPSRGGLPATTALPIRDDVVGAGLNVGAGLRPAPTNPTGYIVNGRKSWVTYAPALDYFFTTVTIRDGDKEPSPAVLAISGKAEGVELINNWGNEAIALRASGSCDVIFKDVFVPAHWLLEMREPGQVRSSKLPPGWSGIAFASVYLGVGEAAVRAVAQYARQRVPTALGKPIAELPHIQRNIGHMQVLLTAAKAVLFDVARKWAEQPECRTGMDAELAAAKYLSTNAAIQATDIALRTAGASGLDRRLPLERLLRDARAGLMHPPQDEAALELIGRRVIRD